MEGKTGEAWERGYEQTLWVPPFRIMWAVCQILSASMIGIPQIFCLKLMFLLCDYQGMQV